MQYIYILIAADVVTQLVGTEEAAQHLLGISQHLLRVGHGTRAGNTVERYDGTGWVTCSVESLPI